MQIVVDKDLQEKCPDLKLGVLLVRVLPKSEYPELLAHINTETNKMAASMKIEAISKLPAIVAGRKAYKATGKDPARYRLSAEALLRRCINGKGLYQINNVVDALNLVSIKSGISIGGYDFEKINGNINMGIGKTEEPYLAIGRGELNIEFLPVLRDDEGAFGSPTSDSERTMVTDDTRKFLLVFFSFEGEAGLEYSIQLASDLLVKFAAGKVEIASII